MTQRKPIGTNWQSWIDLQIAAAQRNGEFDNLEGAGKPLKNLDEPRDEMWWVKQKMANENLDMTPDTLRIRQKKEKWLATYYLLYSEAEVRSQGEKLNKEIQKANNTDLGPLLPQNLLDVEALCKKWRKHNSKYA